MGMTDEEKQELERKLRERDLIERDAPLIPAPEKNDGK